MIQVKRDTLDLETGVRGFVITGKEPFLAPWRQASRHLPRDVAILRRRMRNRPDNRALATALATDATRYLREYTLPVIAAVRAGSSTAASEATTTAGKRQVDRIREGTGLGPSLSRRLAQAMGATLEVDSEPGRGSTFSIDLAVVAAPQLAEEIMHQLAEPILGQRKILYVEDNVSNLRLVERVLARHSKVTFLPAMQGTIGLELAREHKPDMILLDLHLPDLRGHEVLIRLKAEPATHDTPVVVLSADASPGQIRRLRQAGAAAYLTKPINLEELLETVRSCLGDRTGDGDPAYNGDRAGRGDGDPTGAR